ncbi:hypothetical protein FB451DRAFT_1395567 [Mycena latifolia]|nr:hypothetical protein FB451DRAFT_1395567 [Mycena latifolia]
MSAPSLVAVHRGYISFGCASPTSCVPESYICSCTIGHIRVNLHSSPLLLSAGAPGVLVLSLVELPSGTRRRGYPFRTFYCYALASLLSGRRTLSLCACFLHVALRTALAAAPLPPVVHVTSRGVRSTLVPRTIPPRPSTGSALRALRLSRVLRRHAHRRPGTSPLFFSPPGRPSTSHIPLPRVK